MQTTPETGSRIDLHYCAGCGSTTRHSEKETTSTCLRCGTVKQHVVARRAAAVPRPSFESRLLEALGLLKEESDSPKPYKPDGEKKSSTEGAHRPDKGVEYYQMAVDERLLHKQNQDTLKP